MARPADTLRPAWKVYYELAHDRYGDRGVALRVLREELAAGVRVAALDGRELLRAFWEDHRIGVHPVGYYCFVEHDANGEAVEGRLLISDPIPEPIQVELRPVQWLVRLLRGLFGKKPEAESASAGESEEPQTSEAWLRWAVAEWPQKPEEIPAAYARRLYKKPKAREFWDHERSLYTKLYDYELVRKKGS
jgi:hypothetical protein